MLPTPSVSQRNLAPVSMSTSSPLVDASQPTMVLTLKAVYPPVDPNWPSSASVEIELSPVASIDPVKRPIADRWSPRKLMVISLLATGLGSLYMATIPSFFGLCLLFGFWGVTTILAFWAPLIRATRELAGEKGQARAFGILDGGRGLASAIIASAAAYAFTIMVSSNLASAELEEVIAVRRLILSYGFFCALAAICVWLFVPDPTQSAGNQGESSNWNQLPYFVD